MGGGIGRGPARSGTEGLCQERRGLQEVRETAEGAPGAGRGRERWAYGEGGGRTKGTPRVEELGPALGRERRGVERALLLSVPCSID